MRDDMWSVVGPGGKGAMPEDSQRKMGRTMVPLVDVPKAVALSNRQGEEACLDE